MRIRIGIDPGKDGFITVWKEGEGFIFLPIPLSGKEVDYHALKRDFSEAIGHNTNGEIVITNGKVTDSTIYCVIEDVHAKFGTAAKATFNFGFVAGAMEMMLIALGIPYTKVAPKKWQKQMWEGVTVQKKQSSTGKTMVNDTKSTSLIAAKRMFPDLDLRANTDSKRATKPHDGKVDSLLICEYCKRNF